MVKRICNTVANLYNIIMNSFQSIICIICNNLIVGKCSCSHRVRGVCMAVRSSLANRHELTKHPIVRVVFLEIMH